jgi:hypothetical protein
MSKTKAHKRRLAAEMKNPIVSLAHALHLPVPKTEAELAELLAAAETEIVMVYEATDAVDDFLDSIRA